MPSESPHLVVVRLWAAAAWADGAIAKNEALVLTRLIASAELDNREREIARSYLMKKVELDGAGTAGMTLGEREAVYRSACKMTLVDQHVADEERAFLKKLGEVLELDEATIAALHKQTGV